VARSNALLLALLRPIHPQVVGLAYLVLAVPSAELALVKGAGWEQVPEKMEELARFL
jgi:ABC-type Fe3+ transport system permease subunit